MEFGERKRSRKSQSFKLVTDEEPSLNNKDFRGSKDAPDVPEDWLGEESVEIKRQITGMMRILSDRSVRAFQRPSPEQSRDPQVSWALPAPPPAGTNHNTWSSPEGIVPSASSSTLTNGLCTTRSRALRGTKDLPKAQPHNAPASAAEAACCMCNCKDTLQAILQELRHIRKLMQSPEASSEKPEPSAASPSPALRPRPLKRRPVFKVPPLSVSAAPPTPATAASPAERGNSGDCAPAHVRQDSPELPEEAEDPEQPHTAVLNHGKHVAPESEVRLVEDYDVFISKSQLDSILLNYTRSGSLLFRKLVCAFFDDATLASSLPNGKRKRGLNDNRQGLDQNIVGAIKEKYCTEHNIDKLPGPRDWVQILQDQIKLARRRLKRDAADGVVNVPTSSVNSP